jgi:hypothetical protein
VMGLGRKKLTAIASALVARFGLMMRVKGSVLVRMKGLPPAMAITSALVLVARLDSMRRRMKGLLLARMKGLLLAMAMEKETVLAPR